MVEFKEFYNKKTGEKVSIIRGYDVINAYYEEHKCTLYGHEIKKYPSPIAHLGNIYEIDRVGIVNGSDFVVVKSKDDIEILGAKDFERLYSKHLINKTEFLKIESEKEILFLRFNSIKFIAFSKEKRKPITIIHSEGREVLDCNSVLNFDEMEEALKNYVEKEIA